LSSSFEADSDGGNGAVAGPDKRADVAIREFRTADKFLADNLPFLLPV